MSFNPTYGGPPLTLPSTGSYRLVLTYGASAGSQLTLWDAAHAPKSLLSPTESSGGGFSIGETCTSTANGPDLYVDDGRSHGDTGSNSSKTYPRPPADRRGSHGPGLDHSGSDDRAVTEPRRRFTADALVLLGGARAGRRPRSRTGSAGATAAD